MERHFFRDHYEFVLDAWHIALLACLIFFMNLFKGVQIGLVIACSLVLVWIFHSRGTDEPPCGAGVSGEPVARRKAGFD
jgi:MFS superfamily sulfate permease-like transporter